MFQIKIYDSTNVFKKTVSPSDVISDISFSMNTNGWLWQQTIGLAYWITDTSISLWDIVKIYMYNESNKDWLQIYMWYVSKIWRIQSITRQTISLTCLWIASLLTEQTNAVNYIDWDTCWDVVKQIIDSFNSSYGSEIISYTSLSVEDWIGLSDGTFTGNYLKTLETLATMSWFKLFIDWTWLITFKAFSTTPDHYITNKKELESVNIKEDLEWIVNSVLVRGQYRDTLWWSVYYTAEINWVYEDATSIATYGRRYEDVIINNSSQDFVDDYAENYINDRKEPKKETTLAINRKYNLESLKPWDTIKIMNFEYLFNNVKIIKINYTPDNVVLYLDVYTSFGEEINKTFY